MDATVTVKRKSNFIAMLRPFTVKVDGKKMAAVKNGQECSFSVAPGVHQIEVVGAFWAKSQILPMNIQGGESLNFECGIMTKFVVPLIFMSVFMFLFRDIDKVFGNNQPLLLPFLFIVLIVFVGYALLVSFKRDMMYYLKKLP